MRDLAALPKDVFAAIAERLKSQGTVAEHSGRLALTAHAQVFSEADRALMESIEARFRDALFKPPATTGVLDEIEAPRDDALKALRLLIEHGRLVKVADKFFFHHDAIEQAKALLIAHIQSEGKLESVKFKYLLDTTRKYALPLLDYFDTTGITMRVHNTRYLNVGKDTGP